MSNVTITAEQREDMLFQVSRMEAAISKDRRSLRGLKKGTAEYQRLRGRISAVTKQTQTFRKQVEHLASGSATKEEEASFTRMVCEWIEENRRSQRAELAQVCKDRLGEAMMVLMPDGVRAPAWEVWLSQMVSNEPNSTYLTDETKRVCTLYEEHAPSVPSNERCQRAFRLALRSVGLDVEGYQFDAPDMKVLMIASGLDEDDFEVVESGDEIFVKMTAESMRRAGAPRGISVTVN